MARLARVEVFSSDEIAIVHVMNRTVRRCLLMGNDPLTGKNYDHRKLWVEIELKRLAAQFGIDLLCQAILSNHFHLVLRSRPDVVAVWDETEVARRWLMLCPLRKDADGLPEEPTEFELNTIRNNPGRLAETLEQSDFTSVQRRIEALQESMAAEGCRASDKGFLPMTVAGYVELLDWTARTIRGDNRGSTPASALPIFNRLGISGEVWCELVKDFGRLFYAVAGQPQTIDACRSRACKRRYKTKFRTRALLAAG